MSEPPDWYAAGRPHVWLPYAQMKTAPPPLAVAGTEGSRIVLADGRELIDGIASWWTACHGYNHRHIRDAVRRQLDVMPHVMFGGLAHKPAYTGLLITIAADSGSVPPVRAFESVTMSGTTPACSQANIVPVRPKPVKTEPRLAQVGALSAALAEGLKPCCGLPGVRDVRVLGGVGVVELAPGTQAAALRGAFLDAGVWVRPFGHIVYLTPAFTIEADDLARLTAAVRRVVERWSQTFGELP